MGRNRTTFSDFLANLWLATKATTIRDLLASLTGANRLSADSIKSGSTNFLLSSSEKAALENAPTAISGANPLLGQDAVQSAANSAASSAAGALTHNGFSDLNTGSYRHLTASEKTDHDRLVENLTALLSPQGFANQTDSSYDLSATPNTSFSISLYPASGSYPLWISGVKNTKTTQMSASITFADGLHRMYIDPADGVFKSKQTAFSTTDISAFLVLADTTAGANKFLVGEERHTIFFAPQMHAYLHKTQRTKYISGLVPTFTNTTFSVSAGEIRDEDISHTNLAAITTAPIMWRKSGSTNWTWDTAGTKWYRKPASNIQFDNGLGPQDAGAAKYIAYWVFRTNFVNAPIVILMGQRQDDTITQARANNTIENLSYGVLPSEEMVLLCRVIAKNDASPYVEAQNLYSVIVQSGTAIPATSDMLVEGTINKFLKASNNTLAANIPNGSEVAGTGEFTVAENGVTDPLIQVGGASYLLKLGVYNSLPLISGDFYNGTIEFAALAITHTTSYGGGHSREVVPSVANAAGASFNIALNIPAGCRLKGIQLRVNTALTSGNGGTSWSAVWSAGGQNQSICTGQAFAQSTKVKKFFDTNLNSDITTDATYITVSINSGTFSGGSILAIAYYECFEDLPDA